MCAHIGPAVPAVEENFEALGRLDCGDVDVSQSVPECTSSLGIVAIEASSGEDTSALSV